MASRSQIKNKPTTVAGIKEMFEMFQQEGPEAILFLRNVKSVALVDIDKTGKETEVFSVQAHMSLESGATSKALNDESNALSNFITNDRGNAPLSYNAHGHEVQLVDSQNRISKWKLIQKCASINSQELDPVLEEQYAARKIPIFPMGGIACRMEEYGHAFDPGKVYCLLPLAVCSSLPVHINGKFILDYESRRRLLYSNQENFQTVWNHYIIKKCIVPCYVELIRQLALEIDIDVRNKDCREVIRSTYPNAKVRKSLPYQYSADTRRLPSRSVSHPKGLEKYFSYFPKISSNDKAHEYDKDMIKMLFKQLAEQDVEVMPVLRLCSTTHPTLEIDFCPPSSQNKQFYVPYFEFEGTYFSQDEISNICDALIASRMNLYNVQIHVIHGFDECEESQESEKIIQRLSPAIVANFLKAKTNDLLMLPAPIQDTILYDVKTVRSLLKYCMVDENVNLEGLPLLVTDDGMLRTFDCNRVVYYDDLPELCPTLRNISLHGDIKLLLVKYKHAKSGPLQMLTLEKLDEFLNQEVGNCLKGKGEVEITGSVSLANLLPREGWLKRFWNFACRRYSAIENRQQQQMTQDAFSTVQPPSQFIQPLAQWCLLPAGRCIGNRWERLLSLIEINKASNVIHVTGRMADVAKASGLLQPDFSLIDDGFLTQTRDFIQKLIGTTEDPNSFLHALHYENRRQSPRIRNLSREVAQRLLEFFMDSLHRIKDESLPKLKELLIYEDLSGKLRSLENAASVYLVPDSLPHAGVESVVSERCILLIKASQRLNPLHTRLGIANKEVCSVYVEVFLPSFHHFTAEERLIHLEFLLQLWQSDEHSYRRAKLYSSIWPTLKSTPFLERHGNLETVDKFYDPMVPVLKLMLEASKFPPRPFSDDKWLPFLRNISLIQSVSPNMFLQFATEVSQLQNKDDSLEKSRALVEYLRRSDELRNDKSFLCNVRIIPFLTADPLHEDLAAICSLGQKTKICFESSLECTDRNLKLAWTTKAILPHYANDSYFDQKLPLEDLGVMTSISCDCVAKHIENISHSDVLTKAARQVMALPKGRCLKKKFQEILTLSYDFFKKNLRNDDAKSSNCLSQTAFILVEDDRQIAVPNKVTFLSDFNLPPYLFAMSFDYGRYLATFETLGTTKQPTIEQLVGVLSEMHAHSKGKALAPAENDKILQVTKRISDLLEDMPFPEDFDSLFLPGSYGKKDKTVYLFDAKSLVYIDDSHLDDRLDCMKHPRLTFEDAGKNAFDASKISSMISKLPKRYRPMKLSDILTEKMLQADPLPNCDFANELAEKISCIEFITSITRLVKHQLEKHSEEAKKKVEEMKILLGQIMVETKAKVVTALFHSVEEQVEGSEAVKGVFVQQHSGTLTIYISKEQSGAKSNRQYCTISSALIQFFGDLFSEAFLAPHVIFLLGADPSEMHDYLNDHGIFDDNELQDYHQGRYTPGAFVPTALHCLLKNDLTDFKVGDYVAYEVEDPAIDNKDGDPVYIYAIVMEKITQSSNGSTEFYKIRIGAKESKIAHKSELYHFYRLPVADVMRLLPSTEKTDQEESPSQSLDAVKEEIRKLLQGAFGQGEEYAKKVIKRLWLKWHPDKNEVNKKFCESVFKFIQEEADRLRTNTRSSVGQSSCRSNFSSWFGNARNRYRNRGDRYSHDRRSNRHSSYRWSGQHWMPSSGTRNPQSGEARRWFRQAKCDLDAAMKSMPSGHYEWVCFQCYQVR